MALCDLEASLKYILSSRPARVTKLSQKQDSSNKNTRKDKTGGWGAAQLAECLPINLQTGRYMPVIPALRRWEGKGAGTEERKGEGRRKKQKRKKTNEGRKKK
jgi:hypothetical protein